MFDLTTIKQISNIDELKWYMDNIMYENDIFLTSNDIYRIGNKTFNINSDKFISQDHKKFLLQVSELSNQIKLELESLSNFNSDPEHNKVKLYFWPDANEYYLTDNVFKVYLNILFTHNYIYKLFGNECKVNVYNNYYITTAKELIDTLMSYENSQNSLNSLGENLFVEEIKINFL